MKQHNPVVPQSMPMGMPVNLQLAQSAMSAKRIMNEQLELAEWQRTRKIVQDLDGIDEEIHVIGQALQVALAIELDFLRTATPSLDKEFQDSLKADDQMKRVMDALEPGEEVEEEIDVPEIPDESEEDEDEDDLDNVEWTDEPEEEESKDSTDPDAPQPARLGGI